MAFCEKYYSEAGVAFCVWARQLLPCLPQTPRQSQFFSTSGPQVLATAPLHERGGGVGGTQPGLAIRGRAGRLGVTSHKDRQGFLASMDSLSGMVRFRQCPGARGDVFQS